MTARILALVIALVTVAIAKDATAPPAGQIAWVDVEGELWIGKGDGSGSRQLAPGAEMRPASFTLAPVQDLPESFRWPLWSPDGQKLAAFYASQTGGPPTSRLLIFEASSGRVIDSFQDVDLRPIYAYWAPDGSRFAFLHQTGPVHTLSLWPAEDRDSPRKVAAGVPLFFDWRRDSRGLVLHVARDPESKDPSSVTLLDPATGERTLRTSTPAAFGPASYSPDGAWLAYGIEDKNAEARLVIEKRDGSGRKELLRIDPEAAFTWAPDGKSIAVGKTSEERAPLLNEIVRVEIPSGKTTSITKEVVGCFFWSPKSDRILYAVRDLDRGDWEWVVANVVGGKKTRLTRFVPSPALVFVFQFFDQYALSHRFWSPDGRAFVFTGWTGIDQRSGVPPAGPPVVHVVSVDDPSAKPRVLSEGHVAFWSPR